MAMSYFQRSGMAPDLGRIGRSDTPAEAFPLCLATEASDEEIEAAFRDYARHCPPELEWQVRDLL